MADRISATPRNRLLGRLADGVQSIADFADKPFGYPNPPVSMLSDLVGIPAIARTLNAASYGDPLTNVGKANVPLLKRDTADAVLSLAGLTQPMTVATRLAGRGIETAGMAAERTISPGVTAVMQRGGLPAQLLSDLAQGTRSNAITYHGGTYLPGDKIKRVLYTAEDPEMADTYVDMYKDRFGGAPSLKTLDHGAKNPAPPALIDQLAKVHGIDNSYYSPASVFDINLHDERNVIGLINDLMSRGYDHTVLPDMAYGAGRGGGPKNQDATVLFPNVTVKPVK